MVEDMEEELRTLQTDSTNHGDLYDIQEEDHSQSDKEDEGVIFSVEYVFGSPGSGSISQRYPDPCLFSLRCWVD